MTPNEWQRVKDAFQSALELEAEERAVFLRGFQVVEPGLYAELESLLRHHGHTRTNLSAGRFLVSQLVDEEDAQPWAGRDIGPYRVVSKIGEGGMGAVYHAIRIDDHYLKNVAIKVVRTGYATRPYLQRFRSERQILASLEHPNIAHLLDGGATEEGLPYYVMEYIEGLPIDEYCDRHRLDTSARLRLFLHVCAAVEHAHQKLVIHRDLKPANVLVTAEGTPKLLDFGIAKLLEPELYFQTAEADATMARAMTPEYASPEQVQGGPITTASDVYALGVVLYRLLTGHPPYVLPRLNPVDWARTILEADPERPSAVIERPAEKVDGKGELRRMTPEEIAHVRDGRVSALRRRLRGDLDNIVLMALRKDPARRYGSVEQLAGDIERELNGHPVTARPDTISYRAGKFIRRHRIPLAAVALVLVSLTAGIVMTARQARIAERQRALAEQRFNDIRGVAHDLIFDVHDSVQYLAGATPARKLIVQDALRYLNALSRDVPDHAALQLEIAMAYEKVGDAQGGVGQANLGDTKGALDSYSRALAIRKSIVDASPNDLAALDGFSRSCLRVGESLESMGRYQEALQYHQKHLEISTKLAASAPADPKAQSRLAGSWDGMGDIYSLLNRRNDSLRSFEASAAIYRKLADSYPAKSRYRSNWALERKKVGGEYEALGSIGRALEEYRSALTIDQELARMHPQDASAQRDVSIDYSSLGDTMLASGDTRGAMRNYRQALEIDERLTAADPKDASASYYLVHDSYRMGDALLEVSDIPGALASYREATLKAELNAQSDPENALTRSELARIYSKLGKAHYAAASSSAASAKRRGLSTAREWYRKSLEIWIDLRGRGALQGTDFGEPDRIAGELSRCTAEMGEGA